MAKLNQRDTLKALHIGRIIMVTLGGSDGPSFSLDNGIGINPKAARAIIPRDTLSASPQGNLFVTPNDDGLFPGFSQTYKVI